jgi:hypothetical protein
MPKKKTSMRSVKIIPILLASFIALFILGCKSETVRVVSLVKESFGDYPAVILNLETGAYSQINDDFSDLNSDLVGDLWIEPSNPEIAGLKPHGKRGHKGEDVLLKVLKYDLTDDEIKNLEIATFTNKLRSIDIDVGLDFIVKASSGNLYKFRVSQLNIDKGEITLEYRKIL